MADTKDMWRCQTVNCGYVYDPDRGDRRHKIPAVCGAGKKMFRPLSEG